MIALAITACEILLVILLVLAVVPIVVMLIKDPDILWKFFEKKSDE